MAALPTGTVTFLFTDLEGSTRLWQEHPETMKVALARHDELIRRAVESCGGVVVKTTGDGVHAAFSIAGDAVAAAVDAQRSMTGEPWPDTGPLSVRVGVHTGSAELREDDYYGTAVNRAARIMAVAHGGQVVVSLATEELIRDQPPSGVSALDLGEHRLRDLTEPVHLFQIVHPDLAADFPAIRSLDVLPGNLHAQPTELVGRDQLVGDLARAVLEARIVTLTGVGGVGKTRLALQVAAELLPEFPDGAWLVELAPLVDLDALPDAFASPFKLQPRPGQTLLDTVLDFFRVKRLLLVLDNCEHLLDAVAPAVDRIRRECPHVVVLATSREGLAVSGERIVAVPSLPVDDATRLFVERASDARSDFALTAENEAAVRRLCERLDGIPLAIELATARLRSMTAQEVLDRIDRRFRLLTGGSRTALERHRTLQATVDWSYDLLSDTERNVFDRLAVFAGGFALDAAEAVVSGDDVDALDVFQLLAQLVDKSLLIADERDGATRYRMLETIRQYAQERLEQTNDAADARRRHASYYVCLVEATTPHLYGSEQLEWVDRIWPELDNLRAAMAWIVLTEDVDLALRLVIASNVNGIRLSYVALEWATAAVDLPGIDDDPRFPEAASWAAWDAVLAGQFDRGAEIIARQTEALRVSGNERSAKSYQGSVTLALFSGDLERAASLAHECEVAATREGDDYQRVQAMTMLAAPMGASNLDAAIAQMEAARDLARQVGAPGLLSWTLSVLGGMLSEEDSVRTLEVMSEAEPLCRLVGNDHGASHALIGIAFAHYTLGHVDLALRTALRAWEDATGAGAWNSVVGASAVTAFAFDDLGDTETALTLLAPTLSVHLFGRFGEERVGVIARARERLGDERVDARLRTGAEMNDGDALEYARDAATGVLDGDTAREG